ncbi:unnamed protein product [Cylindrotheca closterium]|uniref:Uncharacterized protein n=1 Tax=Cylindrotheca closterium TaxID=2856 RepID=A0AAD2CSR7_9STRA|nr:unnamed protein product [Cylindrotheca closterium]
MLPQAETTISMLELDHEIQIVQDTKSNLSQDETSSDTSCHVANASNDIKVNISKCHVHFSADCEEFHPTVGCTVEEKRKAYINLDDFDQIKKERRSTIKRMNKGSKLKRDQFARGLEGYTREGSKIRQQLISDSIKAVLVEQSKQLMQNERDIGQIAQAYAVHSLPCQLAAYKLGLRDHVAVDESDRDSVGSDIANKPVVNMESVGNTQARVDAPSSVGVCWKRS